MNLERLSGGFSSGLYFDKDQGGVGHDVEVRAPVTEEDHLASVALEALSVVQNYPEWFHYYTKVGVARGISSRIEGGDTSFRPRAEGTLLSHVHKSGVFLRDIVQADVYAREIRKTNLEGLYLPALLNSEEFTGGVPDSWREALTKLSETLPDRTTVGSVAAILMYFSEACTAKDGNTVQGRLNYASTRVKKAFNYGPRYWWKKE